MDNTELWTVKIQNETASYAKPWYDRKQNGIRVAELDLSFAEMDGYTWQKHAQRKEITHSGWVIPVEQHYGFKWAK